MFGVIESGSAQQKAMAANEEANKRRYLQMHSAQAMAKAAARERIMLGNFRQNRVYERTIRESGAMQEEAYAASLRSNFQIITVDIYNMDVGVFTNDKERVATLAKEGCDVEPWDQAALASAHLDTTSDGFPRFSLVVKPEATRATWAHECSHMADFMCDVLGLPISLEATEVRAYLVGHFMAGLEEILG